MKKTVFVCLMMFLSSVAISQSNLNSLEDCLQKAYENSPVLQAQKAKTEEIKYKYLAQRGLMFPQIDASASYLRYGDQLPSKKALFGESFDDYYADISLRQELFAGGKYYLQTQSALLAFDAEQQKLENTERLLKYAVKKAYYELVRNKYVVKIHKELLDKLKEQLSIAQLFYNSGQFSNLDVLKIQTQIASSEDTLKSLNNLVYTNSLLLGQAVGLNEPIYIYDEEMPEIKKDIVINTDCLENNFKDNPEIRYAEILFDKSNYEISIARSANMPDFIFKANYNLEDKKLFPGNSNWYAGVGITLALFRGGSIFSQVEQAKFKQKQAFSEVQQAKLALRIKFESLKATAYDKKSRLETTKKVLELSKEALYVSELKYNSGKLSSTELIDAQTVWNNALIVYNNNIVDYLIILSDMEYLCPNAIIEEALNE